MLSPPPYEVGPCRRAFSGFFYDIGPTEIPCHVIALDLGWERNTGVAQWEGSDIDTIWIISKLNAALTLLSLNEDPSMGEYLSSGYTSPSSLSWAVHV